MANAGQEIQLSDFATTPLYNIKAVVQATNISPSTLRAWERRYNMCSPQRSESGYRLYSDRDVAIIRWLKTQVEAGMAISQAVAWLQTLSEESDDGKAVALPNPSGRAEAVHAVAPSHLDVQNFSTLSASLLKALIAYDEQAAEETLGSAFSLYPVEHVGEHIIAPTMVEIGERWHRGELSITREHFATNYLLQRLGAILRVVPNGFSGPLVWVGCAPGEKHEMGVLLLCIYLRRSGYKVRYLGQDLPQDDMIAETVAQKPALLLFSASGLDSAAALQQLCERLVSIEPPRPMVGYGGRAFNNHPALRSNIAGVFIGATALEAVESVGDLLTERTRGNGWSA